MAYAAGGILRAANSRGAERQDVHRVRRQPHCRTGRRRHVDQGGQRHRLRRLQLRLEIAMIRRVLAARALRAFADGFIAVLLPAYLLALGLGQLEVGFISTATLFGSALATLAVGRWGHRFSIRRLLLGTSLLMAATGLAFAGLSSLWPLLIVAFVGTLNPSSGDVSVFLPLDHTLLAAAAPADARTSVFARYSFAGSLCGVIGAALAPTLELALGLLLARSALSQMDVPARSAFVMTVVTPEERPAAASFTAVPRSLASALSPSLTGAMFAAGTMAAPLVICGVLKTAYDLALFTAFRRAEPRA